MKTVIITLLFLLLPVFLFAQNRPIQQKVFTATSDTIDNYSAQDTVDVKLGISGAGDQAWHILTDYISSAEKAAGTVHTFILANESWWTYAQTLYVRIRSTSDSITSSGIYIGNTSGAITLQVFPDTTNRHALAADDTVTVYDECTIAGN